MAGGFFSGGDAPQAPIVRPDTDGNTNEFSPGGFFRDGADVQADTNAASSASDARNFAEQSRGWAVGPTTESLTGWNAENNSKYYSGRAGASASAAATSAQAAAGSATSAMGYANAAEGSAGTASNQARAASISAGQAADAARNAATSENNAKAYDSDARVQATRAREAAVEADSDASAAERSKDEARIYAQNAFQHDTDAEKSAIQANQSASDAMGYSTAAMGSATAAGTSADNARRSASYADTDAAIAKSWAVGPGGSGTYGTDTNNAHYWAMVARNASDLETVQYDFVVSSSGGVGLPDGVTYGSQGITIDSEAYIVDDPIISYNGVVLSDGEHYTVDSDGTQISFLIGISNDDCITVTGGGEADRNGVMVTADTDSMSPELGQFYFNTTDNTLRIYNGSAWRKITTSA